MKETKNITNRTALILSGIFPGIGQIYKREHLKGFDFIVFQCIGIFLLIYPTGTVFIFGALLVPTLWVWNIADAGIPPSGKRRLRRHWRRRRLKLTMIAWIFAIIVFTPTALIVKHKSNTNGIAIEYEKPKLLTMKETAGRSIPTKILSEYIQLADVEIEPGRSLRADAPMSAETEYFPYVITTGSFTLYRNAKELQLELSQKGYQAKIVSATSSMNQKVHVVIVTGFPTISAAEAIAKRLRQELARCSDCFVATVERPNYLLETGLTGEPPALL